ncbi:bifunctional methylenetetrahydrofolate dehydrogenase/methenyltetrahydrofolate cyclohydrolase FolD [Niveispirillum sp.]|uniref:bifunctional methylenetetrahydrofolate dehydrogenase/methenyltetrahydrofolate cyclohydrolase FolD n=1 Tax=Niveispirillum sp. TaxID=1917217 RepID=UPI001B5A6201|nr:bifunctional methylenetetrahydrofolate dehydrogenase/methenyltetrahydrofolate cyclohydrolase FolD [Niveispirillum sp.]MBP7336006.1 bifunctional methylenetetrahydrofolate dehydrogenase/methenyltetrahydrofolate cyclohydrolase FolD [Niveispirillum sp.]
MTATVINGKAYAASLRQQVSAAVAQLREDWDVTPGLAVVLVGEDPASQVYVRSKEAQAREAGLRSTTLRLPASTSQTELLGVVADLNSDPAVDGILVQLPLPPGIDSGSVLAAIDPAKDVDGFHAINAGLLATGQKGLVPCTPLGCLMLLRHCLGARAMAGLSAVVLGRSNIVGRPMAQLLMRADCTVTIAHKGSRDVPALCRQADILVVAVGRPELVRGDWVKPGAVVIDVGINRVATADGGSRLVGDVAYEEARQVAGALTPVPGGVGPMTIACLLLNTIIAACRRRSLAIPRYIADY